MLDATPTGSERNARRVERRRPDPSALQAWEALDATEAELCAARVKLAAVTEALEAAREREDRLLKMLENRQIRLPHLVLTVAATAVITAVLTLVAVRYPEAFGLTGGARTAVVQQELTGAERYER